MERMHIIHSLKLIPGQCPVRGISPSGTNCNMHRPGKGKGRGGRDRVMVQVRNVFQVSELGAFPPPHTVSRVGGKVL